MDIPCSESSLNLITPGHQETILKQSQMDLEMPRPQGNVFNSQVPTKSKMWPSLGSSSGKKNWISMKSKYDQDLMDKYMRPIPNFTKTSPSNALSQPTKKRGIKEQRKHKQHLRQDFYSQTMRLVNLQNMINLMQIRLSIPGDNRMSLGLNNLNII
jgi:hypothetical protein